MRFELEDATEDHDKRLPKLRFNTTSGTVVVRPWEFSPGPEYTLRAIKIVDIDGDTIWCRFFGKDNKLDEKRIRINLNDLDQAWRKEPSTLEDLPATFEELGEDDGAMICVTERIIDQIADGDVKGEPGSNIRMQKTAMSISISC